MSAESITATFNDGTTDLVFNRQSLTGFKSRWSGANNVITDRRFIDIDHQMKPTGALGTDTHLLTLRQEKINSTTGASVVASVGLVIKVPRDTTVSTTNVKDLIALTMCLMNHGFTDTFVLGDTPSGDFHVDGPYNPVRA